MVGRAERELFLCVRHCGNYMNNHSKKLFMEVEFSIEFDDEILDIVGVGASICRFSYHISHCHGGEREKGKRRAARHPSGSPGGSLNGRKKRVLI